MSRKARSHRIVDAAASLRTIIIECTKWVEVVVPPTCIKDSAPFVSLNPHRRDAVMRLTAEIMDAAREGRVRR